MLVCQYCTLTGVSSNMGQLLHIDSSLMRTGISIACYPHLNYQYGNCAREGLLQQLPVPVANANFLSEVLAARRRIRKCCNSCIVRKLRQAWPVASMGLQSFGSMVSYRDQHEIVKLITP